MRHARRVTAPELRLSYAAQEPGARTSSKSQRPMSVFPVCLVIDLFLRIPLVTAVPKAPGMQPRQDEV